MIHFFSNVDNSSHCYEEKAVTRSYKTNRDVYGDLESYTCKGREDICIKPVYGSFSSNRPTCYELFYKGRSIGYTTTLKDCKIVAEYILV